MPQCKYGQSFSFKVYQMSWYKVTFVSAGSLTMPASHLFFRDRCPSLEVMERAAPARSSFPVLCWFLPRALLAAALSLSPIKLWLASFSQWEVDENERVQRIPAWTFCSFSWIICHPLSSCSLHPYRQQRCLCWFIAGSAHFSSVLQNKPTVYIPWSSLTLRSHVVSLSGPSTLWWSSGWISQEDVSYSRQDLSRVTGFISILCGRFVFASCLFIPLNWSAWTLALVVLVPVGLAEVVATYNRRGSMKTSEIEHWNCSSHKRLLQEAMEARLRKPQCYFLENNISFCFSSLSSCFLCPDTQTRWIRLINLAGLCHWTPISQLKVN